MTTSLNLMQCQKCGRQQDIHPQLGRYRSENKAKQSLRITCKKAGHSCEPILLTGVQAIMARTAAAIVKGLPAGQLIPGGLRIGDQS